jgi:hypothetical protein
MRATHKRIPSAVSKTHCTKHGKGVRLEGKDLRLEEGPFYTQQRHQTYGHPSRKGTACLRENELPIYATIRGREAVYTRLHQRRASLATVEDDSGSSRGGCIKAGSSVLLVSRMHAHDAPSFTFPFPN